MVGCYDIFAHILAFVQFPWRLLLLITFGITICGAYITYQVSIDKVDSQNTAKARGLIVWIIIAIISMAFLTLVPRYAYQIFLNIKGQSYIEEINPGAASNYKMEYDRNEDDTLYLPRHTEIDIFEQRCEKVIANYEDVVYDFSRKGNKIYIYVEENRHLDTTLELPLLMYKGYKAMTSGGEDLNITKSVNNLVEVEIEDVSAAEIVVGYQGTVVQRWSDWITLIGIILCVFLGVSKSRK